jgi:hypothetical protein
MPESLVLFLALLIVMLALDQVDVRWGDDSRHELGNRNW